MNGKETITKFIFRFLQKQPPEVFCIKSVLEISQNSQENICARVSFLIKIQVSGCNFFKK